MKVLLTVAMLFIGSCGTLTIQQNSQSQMNTAPLNNRLRCSVSDVTYPDFANFVYEWYPTWATKDQSNQEIDLHNGSMSVISSERYTSPVSFKLLNVTYGELTDGKCEAIATLSIGSGGTSMPDVIFVYSLTTSAPILRFVHETGDRADGGLRNTFIENNQLIIEQYNADTLAVGNKKVGTNLCCPGSYTRTYYKWDGHSFRSTRKETFKNEYETAKLLLKS